jgi:uncharacterized membrane protein
MAWGLAIFLMKVAGQNLSPYTAAVFSMPGYLLVTAFVATKANYNLSKAHGVAVIVGALYMLGNMAFYKLCETTDVSRLAPATSLNVALPILLGWLLLHEQLTTQKIIGIVLAGVALYLLTAPEKAVSAPTAFVP